MLIKRRHKIVSRDFGNWLSGFIAGEGCFCVTYYERKGTGPYCGCCFGLKQRDDNAEILYEIIKRTNIGRIATVIPSAPKTVIEAMVDEACGRDLKVIRAFFKWFNKSGRNL